MACLASHACGLVNLARDGSEMRLRGAGFGGRDSVVRMGRLRCRGAGAARLQIAGLSELSP